MSDTVTRLLDTSMVAVNDVLPSDSMMAATIMHANTIAMVSSSCQLRIVNAMSEAMASPVTAHPSGDTYEVTSRLMRCLIASQGSLHGSPALHGFGLSHA